MQIGRKIYYEGTTGNVIQDTGERSGSVVETTVEQDFAAYASLAERVPATVGMIQLAYKQYEQDFRECNGFRIDITGATPTLVFSYPDPNAPETPPVYQPPLTEQVASIKADAQTLDERTVGMQAIDDFTLQAQATIDERTVGMQEIDDFTLLQVTDLQQQVDQLKADVAALKGGV